MQILRFSTKEEWLEARRMKITGSRLKDITLKRDGSRKIGYYELIAERLALPPTGQNPMERGTELEKEAIEAFCKETNKEIDASLVIWTRDDNENIAISPDGFAPDETEAVEIKCLASARHIEVLLTNEIPDNYNEQKIQYFVVNEKLQRLYFCFYDPRLTVKQFFYITVTREEVQKEVENYLELQRKTLEDVAEAVNKLSF